MRIEIRSIDNGFVLVKFNEAEEVSSIMYYATASDIEKSIKSILVN